jgi:heptosyltransferase-2
MTNNETIPKKILVIRYRFIGDTVLTVPFLRNLHYQYPYAKIDVLVEKVSGSFLKHCPYINNLINFEDWSIPKGERSSKLINLIKHIFLLRKERYDMAFVLKRSLSSALMAYFSGSKIRAGFDTEYRGLLLTHKVNYDITKHESECFLDLLNEVNIPVKDYYLEAWTTKEEINNINTLLEKEPVSNTKKVLINASASNPDKMWSPVCFAKIIEILVNQYDCQIYITGIEKDAGAYEQIFRNLSEPLKHPVISFMGKTTILESVELIKRMNLVIGVDSGILHLSASVNSPTIGIFGPTNEKKWSPYNNKSNIITSTVTCRPCNLHKKSGCNIECLKNISYNDVISIAAKYLNMENHNET